MADETKKKLLEAWTFSWPVMNVLIGGRSSIDLPEIQMSGHDEATAFVKSYGYDPDKNHDARLMHATICEALSFIERALMPKEWKNGVQPPDEVLLCRDPRDLLIWACDRSAEVNQRRIWSCAVLRVMHTIAHIEGAFRYSDIDVARDEITGRFQSIVAYDERGDTWIQHSGQAIKIFKMDWKTQKSRESILVKLLHKRANVAETIYDMLGLRVVTEHQSDVMQVVKILYRSHVISFPNAIPSRSRNSIIDPELFTANVEQFRGEYLAGKVTDEQLAEHMQNLVVPAPRDENENQHSGSEYRAIQMTCRQLIRTPRPLTILRKNIQAELDAIPAGDPSGRHLSELVNVFRNISRLSGDDEFSFFPYEIQVMDKESWDINTTGKASHAKYKKSQLRAARRRILNEILPLA
ncbi:MAG: TIGR04552 family protein [Pseudomonadota bacterium]